MVDALVYSDNIYFGQEALEIGKDTYEKKVKTFGFGDDLNMPFTMKPAQVSNDGINQTSYSPTQHMAKENYSCLQLNKYMPILHLQQEEKLVYPRVIQNEKQHHQNRSSKKIQQIR